MKKISMLFMITLLCTMVQFAGSLSYAEDSFLFESVVATGLNSPESIELGPDGKLYVIENRKEITKMDRDGSNQEVFYVDHSNNNPTANAMTFDKAGNLLVADSNQGCVKKIDPKGNATKLNIGKILQTQEIVLDSNGHVFAFDTYSGKLYKMNADGSEYTLFAKLPFYSCSGLAIDAFDNLYTCSSKNVVKFTPSGTKMDFVSVPNADGNANGIIVGEDGYVYVYTRKKKILKYDLTGKLVQTFPTSVGDMVGGVYVDEAGNIYYTDASKNLYKISNPNEAKTTMLCKGTDTMDDLAMGPDGKLYTRTYDEGLIKRVNKDGTEMETFVTELNVPSGVAFDSTGNLIVSEKDGKAINIIDPDGNIEEFRFSGELNYVAVDSQDRIYTFNQDNHGIYRMDNDGSNKTRLEGITVEHCRGITVDRNDNIYISGDGKIIKIAVDGTQTDFFSKLGLRGITAGKDDYIYMIYYGTDYTEYTLKCDLEGNLVKVIHLSDYITGQYIEENGDIYVIENAKNISKLTNNSNVEDQTHVLITPKFSLRDGPADPSAFALSGIASKPRIVSAEVKDSKVYLTLDANIRQTDKNIEVSYTKSGMNNLIEKETGDYYENLKNVEVKNSIIEVFSVGDLTAIKVDYGTSLEALKLPTSAEIVLSDSTKKTVEVTSWDKGTPAYEGEKSGTYVFKGMLKLDSDIYNPDNKQASVKVVVAPKPLPEITRVDAINDITVDHGTELSALGLPDQVTVTLDNSSTTSVAIKAWDNGTPTYDGSKAGTYVFSGTLTESSSYNNTNDIKAKVSVKVKEKPSASSVSQLEAITVDHGTELSALGLPDKATVTLDNQATTSAAIKAWDNGTPTYDGSKAGTYVFSGTLEMPTDYQNKEALKANISVTVKEKPSASSVSQLEAITVDHGTELSALGLPDQVTVTLDNQATTSAAIKAWDNGTPTYDGSKAGTYVFSGTLEMPTDYQNKEALKANISVTVKEKPSASSVSQLEAITVDHGTELSALGLPDQVTVTLDNSSTTSAAIKAWDNGTPTYDGSKAGTYVFSGELEMPTDYQNKEALKAKISVTVKEKPSASSVSQLEAITVDHGTELSALGLPDQVTVTLDNSSTTSAAIKAWDNGTPTYDGSKAGTYVFSGTLEMPTDYQNKEALKAKISVTVKEKPSVSSVSNLEGITVDHGTELSALGLPDQVTVTLDNSSTTSAAIKAWDNGTPTYDGSKAGTYVFSGTLADSANYQNPNGLKVNIHVTVKEKPVVTPTIVSVNDPDSISVSKGTTLNELGLPERVAVQLSDRSSLNVLVEWDSGTPTYDGDTEGTYIFSGTIAKSLNYQNPNDLKVSIHVTVKEKPTVTPEITAVSNIDSITVPNGTALKAIALPKRVTVSLSNATTTSAIVVWDNGTPAYSGETAGTYVFSGTISETLDYLNPNALKASVKVTVKANPVETPEITEVNPIAPITVSNGTALNAVGLPIQATVTLSDATTTSAIVVWDNGTPTYEGSKAGLYVFTGTIEATTEYLNPNALKASVQVTVKAASSSNRDDDDDKDSGSIGGSSGGASQGTGSADNGSVVVNGEEKKISRETQTIEAGKTTTQVALDEEALKKAIEAIKGKALEEQAREQNIMKINVKDTTSENTVVGLSGDLVKEMEQTEFDILINDGGKTYKIPAKELSVDEVADKLNVDKSNLKRIHYDIHIDQVTGEAEKEITKRIEANDAQLLVQPTAFKISAVVTKQDGSQDTLEIDTFGEYVTRGIEIPSGVNINDVTTGIVFDQRYGYSQVPTYIETENGKSYARIKSLTNSVYSLISNPVKVSSVKGHWSEAIVNDMASRLILTDYANFEANKKITRGELATYMVKALGLYREDAAVSTSFKDVKATDANACAIAQACEWHLISGYEDSTFRADKEITREEAMVIFSKAMVLANYEGTKDASRFDINSYADVPTWSKPYIQKVLDGKVFMGRSATDLGLKDNLTHSEALAAIRNLLIKAELINK